jgi:hypothetical protein
MNSAIESNHFTSHLMLMLMLMLMLTRIFQGLRLFLR